MKRVAAFVSIAFMTTLLGVNVYNSVVDARSWGASIPESILTARIYFKVVNPGTFFRVASPLNQLFALAALVVCWKSGKSVRLAVELRPDAVKNEMGAALLERCGSPRLSATS